MNFGAGTNGSSGANGWPAWWADPVEHGAEQSVCAEGWVGQSTSPCFVHYAEMDFFEYSVWANNDRLFTYNGTIIDWSGVYSSGYPNQLQNTANRRITLPSSTNFQQPHRYGFLWVPASPYSQGYFQWYFDGLPTSDRVTYNYYSCTQSPSPPPTTSGWPFTYGVADCLHPELIINTSNTGPVHIYGIDVWQASAAGNLVQ